MKRICLVNFFIAKLGPNTPSLATIKSILSFVDTPLLAAGWFIVLSISLCSAATNVQIFDAPFTRQTGTPVTIYTENFGAIQGPGIVTVYNGIDGLDGLENDALEKVSSSIIKVNGTIILNASNFNQQVTQIQAVADLKADGNLLEVTLNGKPGGGIYIVIEIQVDTSGEIEVKELDPGETGTVEVTDQDSPIVGSKVEIPIDVIPVDTETINVSIIATEIPDTLLPVDVHPAGLNIDVQSTVPEFVGDVQLTIPYNDSNNDGIIDGTALSENKVKVKHLIDGRWEEADIAERDPENNFIVINTSSFSNFLPYVSTENVALAPTQDLDEIETQITIDGNPEDWGKISPSLEDLVDDNSEGAGHNDISNVYTAMDDENVYVMLEVKEGEIAVGDVFSVFLNYKEGEVFDYYQLDEDFDVAPYADMAIALWYQDNGLSIHFYNTNNYWDTHDEIDINGCSYAINNNIIEVRISRIELGNPEYFNPVRATSLLLQDGSDPKLCDDIIFGPYIYIEGISYRIHENNDPPPYYRVNCWLFNDQGQRVDDDILSSLKIYPSDGETPVFETIPEQSHDRTITGRWDDYLSEFTYKQVFYEDFYYEISMDANEVPLTSDDYIIKATDSTGYTYEGYAHYKGQPDLPTIHSESVETFFDQEGSLHIYWESPNMITSSDNGRVLFYDYNNINPHGLWGRVAANMGMMIVDNDTIQKLQSELSGQYTLSLQVLDPDWSGSRTCSGERIVDLTDTNANIPLDWQQPIMEDWAEYGIDHMKWYPKYWRDDRNVAGEEAIINTNDVTLATPGWDGDQAVDYFSKYNLEGNFDIQVEFQTVDWPQDFSEHGLSLKIGYGGRDRVFIGLYTFSPDSSVPSGTYYFSWLYKDNAWVEGAQVPVEENTSNISGKFRIKRFEGIISTYYYGPENVWVLLHEYSPENDIGPQPVRMQVYSTDGLSGPYKATFSNFKRTN